jgi:ABC-type multidrug transport system ATPase subunit
LLFLDEPTSGLDAAAADNIMREIVRVAKEEKLIILCSIHQPSTKVYNGFDKLMILSRGREAFSGDLKDAPTYFDSIGAPVPPQMNPAGKRMVMFYDARVETCCALAISPCF